MVHESLPLAIAPPAFPRGRLVFSASLVAAYGFVMADSVRENGAATPGKCRRCSVRDWLPTRKRSAPTLLQRDPCVCAASPAPVFSAPSRGTRSRVLLVDREPSALQEAFPLYTALLKRRGEDRKGGMRQKERNRQHSGRQPVATTQAVAINGRDQVPELSQSVLVASGRARPPKGATVVAGSWLDRRCNEPFSRRTLSTGVSLRVESSYHT